MLAFEGRRNGDHERICRFSDSSRPQVTFGHGSADDYIQIWFDDMDVTAIDRLDSTRVYIDAVTFFLRAAKTAAVGSPM